MLDSATYFIKYLLRICDCLVTRKQQTVKFRRHCYPFYATYWWNNVSQTTFDQEIVPYFEALDNFRPSVLLDVGAATGHFSIIAAKIFPGCTVYAFEPSRRQRLLLSRNAKLNDIATLNVESIGLWNTSDVLPFRTVGAESSVAPASRFQGQLAFPEYINVAPLDKWIADKSLPRVDLIKIDAEGAELEILQGAEKTLAQFRPRLLVQAYHLRDGQRTFERCAAILRKFGYRIREHSPSSGLLVASE